MEETPVGQEDPPNNALLPCIIKEEGSQANWQAVNGEPSTQNSKLYFLTVEYVDDIRANALQFSHYSPAVGENEKIGQFDPNLSSSGRYSPLYNAFVIPTTIREDFNNSVVVLPATKNQINIFVDPTQASKSVILEEHNGSGKVENATVKTTPAQLIINSQIGFENQLNIEESPSILGDKVIITAAADFAPSGITPDVALTENTNITPANTFFCDKEDKSRPGDAFIASCGTHAISGGEYAADDSAEPVPLSGQQAENKTLLDSSDYVIQESDLKEDELLTTSGQNNDLLISHANLEVDAYNLTEETYNASEDASNYGTVEEQLNITMEKPENEYLLPDAIPFEDTETSILHSNLEVFPSQEIENNELMLFDKSRLRPPKKSGSDHLGFDYWCADCDDALGVKCSKHEVKVIQDKPVLSRARATLPKEYLAINKLGGDTDEEGVFARKTIPKRTQFGPVEGVLLKDVTNDEKNGSQDQIKLLLEVETGEFLTLDISQEDQSNWMRFVRPAKTLKEQNLVLTQQGISLYFTTTEVIPPRHELKVWYSPQYAEKRKLEILKDLSWTCFECPAAFGSSAELQKHLSIHEGDRDYDDSGTKKKAKIPLSKGVPNLLRVKGSNSRSRNAIEKSSLSKENECWSCHRIFPRTYSLKRHMLLVHSEKDKENSGILLDENNDDDSDKASVVNTLFKKKISNGTESEWLCTHCNLTFDNPSVLNLHTLTHAAEDLELEAVSGKKNCYGLPSELSSVYHEGEFLIENGDVQCPQCTREFPSKRELIDHASTHGKMTQKKCCSNSSKPYKCDQCYKTFATDTSLQKHMLVHGGDDTKPYQCETCFKRFLNNSALACHLKTHCDKKCFECPICKQEFAQVFGLKEHVKIHSTEGHFTCPHCNKVFDGYSVIRKHIRAFHSGHQHICNDCGKLCPTLDKLRMHSLKHSDHREFLCANCGKQFKRKDKLKEHMKRMHSAEREMKMLSSALRIPNTRDRRFSLKMSPMAYDRFVYKCRNCMVGFKRRGMLVNHLAKRHPDIVPDTVPELNLPIMKTTRDYFCQYCDKIYKSSSKRKAHILKNHPGAELPLSNRQKGGIPDIPGMPNPTFSQTVGSVKTTPHGCQWCHKQYASKAKLLQHQRKKHMSLLSQTHQTPKSARNADSPVDDEILNNNTTRSKSASVPSRKTENRQVVKLNIPAEANNQGIYIAKAEICQVVSQDIPEVEYKKAYKITTDNMSNDFLNPTITELNNVYTDYKLSFVAPQEHLLKMIEVKEGTDGIMRDDVILTAQVSRAWPNIPPFPPR